MEYYLKVFEKGEDQRNGGWVSFFFFSFPFNLLFGLN